MKCGTIDISTTKEAVLMFWKDETFGSGHAQLQHPSLFFFEKLE